jgi:chromate reductase
MILVISGSNRPNSNTAIISQFVKEQLAEMYDGQVEMVSLLDLQDGLVNKEMYDASGQSALLRKEQNENFVPADKWVLVSPEYNGSFPGIVKVLFDALSVRDADVTFHDKKVALIGLSSGRTGNWLGMNQLASILNYLKMNVFHNKVAISHISKIIEDGRVTDAKTKKFIHEQMNGFIKF